MEIAARENGYAMQREQERALTTVLSRLNPEIAEKEWDVFISHASEDKDNVARPLAQALRAEGYRVWFDEFTLTVGDGLRA